MILILRLLPLLILLLPQLSLAETGISAITLRVDDDGNTEYSVTLQILALMTLLTFLPAMLMMMTCFTRIIIVFSILRQAMGLQQTPSNQIMIGLALFLTFYIMSPVADEIYEVAVVPYMAEELSTFEALEMASRPLHTFMISNTRESDLNLFMRLAELPMLETPDQVPLRVLIPAFVISELKTALQIGFMLFIPFLVIDLVVASVLMAMGMMMLSPVIVSLPFKIMLFVLADGWAMVVGTLAASYGF